MGADAATYLQAMVSNDVEALGVGETCEALLLTPKARVIAPLVVVRRDADDFLLVTERGLGERVRSTLVRSRFAAKCEIESEEHSSVVVVGRESPPGGVPTADFGVVPVGSASLQRRHSDGIPARPGIRSRSHPA